MNPLRGRLKTITRYVPKLTQRQRENLGKVFLNGGNAILVAWVLTNVLGQVLRLKLFLVGVGLYVIMVLLALRVDR